MRCGLAMWLQSGSLTPPTPSLFFKTHLRPSGGPPSCDASPFAASAGHTGAGAGAPIPGVAGRPGPDLAPPEQGGSQPAWPREGLKGNAPCLEGLRKGLEENPWVKPDCSLWERALGLPDWHRAGAGHLFSVCPKRGPHVT